MSGLLLRELSRQAPEAFSNCKNQACPPTPKVLLAGSVQIAVCDQAGICTFDNIFVLLEASSINIASIA